MSDAPLPLPAFTSWPTFPFEGELRVKQLADPVDEEPPRHGEDPAECSACRAPDPAYIWVSDRWRVRALDRPTGLPMVLILESRSHLDMGDLPNLLAAELGVLTVRLERAIRSLDGVARVHVNRWGDGSAHLHVWFLARPIGRLQLRGTFLSLWDDILPRIPEPQWRENLAHVAAWLADFGGEALAEPPHIDWQTPAEFSIPQTVGTDTDVDEPVDDEVESDEVGLGSSVVAAETAELTTELSTSLSNATTDDGVTTVLATPERSGDRTVNLGGMTGSETVRIPAGRTPAGETVNLSEVTGGETLRFSATGRDGDDDTATTDVAPKTTADKDAATDTDDRDSSIAGSGGETMRFATSGISGSGSQTMVFPTGDAMEANRAETTRFAAGAGSDPSRSADDTGRGAPAGTSSDTHHNDPAAGDDSVPGQAVPRSDEDLNGRRIPTRTRQA